MSLTGSDWSWDLPGMWRGPSIEAGKASGPYLTATATRTFHHSSTQIRLARTFVREVLAGWGLAKTAGTMVPDLVLMVSELVTNAVLHGAGVVEVSVSLTADAVRLTVSDEGTHDVPRELSALRVEGLTGRGLRIVDRLASAWGSGRNRHGATIVWLEVARG